MKAELESFEKHSGGKGIYDEVNSRRRRLKYLFRQDTLARLRRAVQYAQSNLGPAFGILGLAKFMMPKDNTNHLTSYYLRWTRISHS